MITIGDEKRINRLVKKGIRKKLKVYKRKRRLRRKGVRLLFKVLEELKSSGICFEKPREEISSKKTIVSVDIYSLIPVFKQGFVKDLFKKKFSLILDMEDLRFKLRTVGKEIPLPKVEETKKKELLRQVRANYKNIEYIQCW